MYKILYISIRSCLTMCVGICVRVYCCVACVHAVVHLYRNLYMRVGIRVGLCLTTCTCERESVYTYRVMSTCLRLCVRACACSCIFEKEYAYVYKSVHWGSVYESVCVCRSLRTCISVRLNTIIDTCMCVVYVVCGSPEIRLCARGSVDVYTPSPNISIGIFTRVYKYVRDFVSAF